MIQNENTLNKVYVIKCDFHSNFNYPIFIHASFTSALSQFSKLINDNYSIEELLDPSKKLHLDFEKWLI